MNEFGSTQSTAQRRDITPGAIIVIGGHPPDRRVLDVLPLGLDVICADSGLDHALRLGLVPTTVIGDMDSVSDANLAAARSAGCSIVEFPPHKDSTDTELALRYAIESGVRRLTLVWGGGDRIDHVLGVISALGHPRLAELESLDAWLASDHIQILHSSREIVADHLPETTVSLLPIGSGETVVTTRGLRWNLQSALLSADSARGVSNVVEESPYWIRCESGVVAIVVPGSLSDTDSVTRSAQYPGVRESR